MEVGDAREVDRRSTRMEKVLIGRGLHFLVFQSPIIVWEVTSDASKTVSSILSKLNIYNMLFIYHYDWMYKYHNYISSNKCTSVCAIFRLIRLILTKIYSIVHSFDWNKILLMVFIKNTQSHCRIWTISTPPSQFRCVAQNKKTSFNIAWSSKAGKL